MSKPKISACPICEGTGITDGEPATCPDCEGTGAESAGDECAACDGEGVTYDCPACRGEAVRNEFCEDWLARRLVEDAPAGRA